MTESLLISTVLKAKFYFSKSSSHNSNLHLFLFPFFFLPSTLGPCYLFSSLGEFRLVLSVCSIVSCKSYSMGVGNEIVTCLLP